MRWLKIFIVHKAEINYNIKPAGRLRYVMWVVNKHNVLGFRNYREITLDISDGDWVD